MLVLDRKPQERTYLEVAGLRIEVMVLGIAGRHVRLGIEAPAEVHIHRGQDLPEAKSKDKGAKGDE